MGTTVTFAHLADIHLGNDQYGSADRFDDFARSFQDAAERCIDRRVDFAVLAGDLFHKKSVEPMAMRQAVVILRLFREAGIPVIAVEGNHDRPLYGEEFSWTQFLASEGLLIRLSPVVKGDPEPRWASYIRDTAVGSYVDIAGVRVAGVPYLGATAPDFLRRLARAMGDAGETPAYVVLAAHAGLKEVVPHAPGCLAEVDFEPLRSHVDYVALGHIHRRFERGDWLYNPGSLEACASDEADLDHGFFIVSVDPAAPAGAIRHRVSYQQSRRRPYRRVSFLVDGHAEPAGLMAALDAQLRGQTQPDGERPVVELSLEGVLSFDRHSLDLRQIEQRSKEILSPAVLQVRNRTVDPEMESGGWDETRTRDEVERNIFAALFGVDNRFSEQVGEWARLVTDIKNMALASTSGEGIVQTLETRAVELGYLPSEESFEEERACDCGCEQAGLKERQVLSTATATESEEGTTSHAT